MTRLTPAAARDAAAGQTIHDHEVTGLQLRCRSTKKTWHLYYRTRDGKERRPSLGQFPELPLSRARELARDLKEQIARGEDPSRQWQDKRQAPTVSDLCDRYLAEHADRNKSARAAQEDRWMIEAQIRPGLGSKRLEELDTAAVDKFLDDVLARRYWRPDRWHKVKPSGPAPSQRNHVRTLLRSMLNKARVPFRMLPANVLNPVDETRELTLQKRRRKAEPAELARIADAVRALAETRPAHAAVLTALFATGARKSEILYAKAGEYNGRSIVKEDHKTAAYIGAKEIPLPPEVCAMLDRVRSTSPDSPLFPGVALKRIWHKIRTDAGCPDLQLLDARRTFASYALSAGVGLDAIGKLFGHTDKQTTDGYAWLLDEARRGVADTGAAAVMEVWGNATAKPA